MNISRCSQITVCLLVAVALSMQAQRPATPFSIEARWSTGYGSFCDLESKQFPKTATVGAGAGWTQSGCSDLDKQSLAPLIITVTNTDTAAMREFTTPLLSEVTVRVNGAPVPAGALYWPWVRGFLTDFHGRLVVELAPREKMELIYLLPKAGANSGVVVKGYGMVTPQ